MNEKTRHRLSYVEMIAGKSDQAIADHLDTIADAGWEPFHLQEVVISGRTHLMIVSRRRVGVQPASDETSGDAIDRSP